MVDFRIRGFSKDRISLEGNLQAQTHAAKVYLFKAELSDANMSLIPGRQRGILYYLNPMNKMAPAGYLGLFIMIYAKEVDDHDLLAPEINKRI